MSECEAFTTTELAYLGHDNALTIIPYSNVRDRVNYNMTNVTQVSASADLLTSLVTGDDVAVTSDDVPAVVWWNQDSDGIWQIHLKVGKFTGIAAGSYKLRVVITEPIYPNGVVIADDLLVDVVDVP